MWYTHSTVLHKILSSVRLRITCARARLGDEQITCRLLSILSIARAAAPRAIEPIDKYVTPRLAQCLSIKKERERDRIKKTKWNMSMPHVPYRSVFVQCACYTHAICMGISAVFLTSWSPRLQWIRHIPYPLVNTKSTRGNIIHIYTHPLTLCIMYILFNISRRIAKKCLHQKFFDDGTNVWW